MNRVKIAPRKPMPREFPFRAVGAAACTALMSLHSFQLRAAVVDLDELSLPSQPAHRQSSISSALGLPEAARSTQRDMLSAAIGTATCPIRSPGDCRAGAFPNPHDPAEVHAASIGIQLNGSVADAVLEGALSLVDTVTDSNGNPPGPEGDLEAPNFPGEPDPNGFNLSRSVLLFKPDSDPLDAVDDSFIYVGWDISDRRDGDGFVPVQFDSDDNGSAENLGPCITTECAESDKALESYRVYLQTCATPDFFNPTLGQQILTQANPMQVLLDHDTLIRLELSDGPPQQPLAAIVEPGGLDTIAFPTADGETNPSNACLDEELKHCASGNDIELLIKRVETTAGLGPYPYAIPDSDEAIKNRFALSRILAHLRTNSAGTDAPGDIANVAQELRLPELDVVQTVRCQKGACMPSGSLSNHLVASRDSVVEFEIRVTNTGNQDLAVKLGELVRAEEFPAVGAVDIVCGSFAATLTSPRRKIVDQAVTPANALGLNLNGQFFFKSCDAPGPDPSFIENVKHGTEEGVSLGWLLGADSERRAGACGVTLGDMITIRFSAEVKAAPDVDESAFCAPTLGAAMGARAYATGSLTLGSTVLTADQHDVLDSLREFRNGRDDNNASLRSPCCVAPNFNGLTKRIDCNRNGVSDICDILAGSSRDCDGDDSADECSPGCNANGRPDACDISTGESLDCNMNGVPDECEIDPRSMAPGGPYYCKELCANDCDKNGIPDECDVAGCAPNEPSCGDCDPTGLLGPNGVPDACDIGDCPPNTSWCQDCDTNGVPDGCEISEAACTLNEPECLDCDENHVLDSCRGANCGLSVWRPRRLVDGLFFWEQSENWCPNDLNPDNRFGRCFDVLMPREAPQAVLSQSKTIESLTIEFRATLAAEAKSGAAVRTLSVVGEAGVRNLGTIRATDGRRLVIDAPQIDQTGQGCDGGVLEATDGDPSDEDPNAKSIIEVSHATVRGGSIRTLGGRSEVHLIGGAELIDVCVNGVVVPDGQVGRFSEVVVNDGVMRVAPGGQRQAFFAPAGKGGILRGNGGGDDCVRLGGRSVARIGDLKTPFRNDATHKIDGSGIVFGPMTNAGVIEANRSAGDDTLILSAPGPKTSTGVLRATDRATLRILDHVTQTSPGRIEATDGGTVLVHANVSGTGGLASAGGRIELSGVTVEVGDCNAEPPPGIATPSRLDIIGSALRATSAGAENELVVNPYGVVAAVSGSHVHFANRLTVIGSAAASARLILSGSSSLTTRRLELRGGGELLVGASSVVVQGLFRFDNTNESDVSWLGNSSLRFDSGINAVNSTTPLGFAKLEVGGLDSGFDPVTHEGVPFGFDLNFSLKELVIGSAAHVSLCDLIDNGNRIDNGFGSDEALYVSTVRFLDSTGRLNTNGLHLYYKALLGDKAQIVDLPPDPFDANKNGEIEMKDVSRFQTCWSGSQSLVTGGCSQFDRTGDGKVNKLDWSNLTLILGGPTVP